MPSIRDIDLGGFYEFLGTKRIATTPPNNEEARSLQEGSKGAQKEPESPLAFGRILCYVVSIDVACVGYYATLFSYFECAPLLTPMPSCKSVGNCMPLKHVIVHMLMGLDVPPLQISAIIHTYCHCHCREFDPERFLQKRAGP